MFTLTVTIVSSDVSSTEGGSGSVPGVSQPQPYCQTASCHESSSSIMPSASDKDGAGESGPGEQIQQPSNTAMDTPILPKSSVAHTYTGGPRGKKENEGHT